MNLKTACKSALIITLVSIPLTLLGYVLIYTPILIRSFHFINLTNAVVGLLTVLLRAGGFALFMSALLSRFKDSAANTKALVVIAGVLVLLGTLIGIAQSSMHSVGMYRHLPFLQFLFYMALYGVTFLSGLCLGIFILAQIGGISSAKGLAAAALVTTLMLCGLIIISYAMHFSQYFNNPSILHSLGLAAMWSGYLSKFAAMVLFLVAWLKQQPLSPEAGVIDPAPEPIPPLSAEQRRPESGF